MDDDQFHGNLNVQGGNPEPAAPVQPDSEMSRRMSEILGSFDDGATTADAISNGNGQVVQGTAIRADAPRPDFAQQPAAAPVQADVTMATEGAYDPNTGVQGGMQNMATEPVYDSFATTPGATPVMTGTPRSSIEQAAAEEAAREAVAKAERKRIDPKIIIGVIVAIILVAAVVVVVALVMNGDKKDSGKKENNQSQVDPEPEPEPTVEMQRIGTADHGYVSVPKEWVRTLENTSDGSFRYTDTEKKNIVALNSAAGNFAESFAKEQLNDAKTANMSQPQMTNEKHGSYDMYKVFYYEEASKQWTFKYVFEAEDGRTHYVQVIVMDKTSSLISSVPDSWSLNQNSEGAPAKTEEKSEDKTEEKTEDKSDKSDKSDKTNDGADDDTDDGADDTEE
jgi:hypothetical protein